MEEKIKKKITQTKMKIFNKWNENIKSKNRRNVMFQIAKDMETDNKDFRRSKYIKNAKGKRDIRKMKRIFWKTL